MVHSTSLPFGELLVFSFIRFFLPVLLNTSESMRRKRLRTLTGDIFTKQEVSFSPSSLQLGLKPEEIKKSILLNSLEPGSLSDLPRAKYCMCWAWEPHWRPTAWSSKELCQGLSPQAAPTVFSGHLCVWLWSQAVFWSTCFLDTEAEL